MAQKSGCYRGGRKDLIVLRRCAQTGRVYLDSQKAEGNVPYGCATSNPPPLHRKHDGGSRNHSNDPCVMEIRDALLTFILLRIVVESKGEGYG